MTTEPTEPTESTTKTIDPIPTTVSYAEWQRLYRVTTDAFDRMKQASAKAVGPLSDAMRTVEDALHREYKLGEKPGWTPADPPSDVLVRVIVNRNYYSERPAMPEIGYQTADLMHASWLTATTLRRLAMLQEGLDAYIRGELASLPFVAPWEDRGAWSFTTSDDSAIEVHNRVAIDEETSTELIASWYKARPKSPRELRTFVDNLLDKYTHDYGTIVHAAAASALAAVHAVNADPLQGGLSGFQAGAIAHEFVRKLLAIQGPLSFVDYERMLTPRNADRFEKTIPRGAMDWLQTKARERLAHHKLLTDLIERETARGEVPHNDDHPLSAELLAHLTAIAEGVAPFGYTITEND
jgi:hypothetical protein